MIDEDWSYAVPSETAEYERQRVLHYAAVSDAKTKQESDAAKVEHPLAVWCPLREQFIDTPICARMQSQKRILRKCKRVGCKHAGAPWAQSLTEARREDDPGDDSLGYLKTEQYRIMAVIKKRKRTKNNQ